MTYVIAEPCIDVKDLSCIEVCPVDCIHPTDHEPDFADVSQLFIDPEECIDCDACVEACPVDAIFREWVSSRVKPKAHSYKIIWWFGRRPCRWIRNRSGVDQEYDPQEAQEAPRPAR
jgi:NAD-dependent dihydropyrimidine dehydrogenase PreA subunit